MDAAAVGMVNRVILRQRAKFRGDMAAVRHLGLVVCVFGPPANGIWWSLSLCKIWLESVH